MSSSKPIIEMTNAILRGDILVGMIYSHPRLGDFPDGEYIRSSTVVSVKDNIIETRNTIYKVIHWVVETNTSAESIL